jgi:hypothetical protein
MLQFLYGVRPKQNRGLPTGPEERANLGRPFATEHLKRAVCLAKKTCSK